MTEETRPIKLDNTPKKIYDMILLDCSGSMSNVKDVTLAGFNKYIKQVKKDAAETSMETYCSLITFNSQVDVVYFNENASKLQELPAGDYITSGGTALNDAIAIGINRLQAALKDETNVDVTINIFTDGEEMSSVDYPNRGGVRNPDIVKLIEQVQKDNKWTITFTGVGTQAQVEQVARAYSIPKGNAQSYRAGGQGAMLSMANLTQARSMRTSELSRGVDLSAVSYFTSPTTDIPEKDNKPKP